MPPFQKSPRKSPRTLFEYFYSILVGAFVVVYTLSWVIRLNPSLASVPWLYAVILILFDVIILFAVYRLMTKEIIIRKSKRSNIYLSLQQLLYIGGIIIYNITGFADSQTSETPLFLYLLVTWLILPLCFRTESEPDNRERIRYNIIFVTELVAACIILYLVFSGWAAGY